jgi:hypothetical protein
MLARPDWANRLALLFGIRADMELFVYLGLVGLAFLCLIYYSAQRVLELQKSARFKIFIMKMLIGLRMKSKVN